MATHLIHTQPRTWKFFSAPRPCFPFTFFTVLKWRSHTWTPQKLLTPIVWSCLASLLLCIRLYSAWHSYQVGTPTGGINVALSRLFKCSFIFILFAYTHVNSIKFYCSFSSNLIRKTHIKNRLSIHSGLAMRMHRGYYGYKIKNKQ